LNLLENIIQKDKELLIFLNALGNESWDSFWLFITNQFSWFPLYLFFSYLIFKSYGWKKLVALLIFTGLLITFSDQFVNFIKNFFQRLRPNNDPSINQIIRIVKNSGGYSFVSGHATSSMAVSLFVFLTLKKYYKYILLIFFWPLFFGYSRIYLGVHFPVDILSGFFLGAIIGTVFYKLSLLILQKVK
jgi:undecaprenyl-diphosphatase